MQISVYEYAKLSAVLATSMAASNDSSIKTFVERYKTFDPIKLAYERLKDRDVPFGIVRNLPNGTSNKISVEDMIFPKIIQEPFDNDINQQMLLQNNSRSYPFYNRFTFNWNIILFDYLIQRCPYIELSNSNKSIIDTFIRSEKVYCFVCSILEQYMTNTQRLELLKITTDRLELNNLVLKRDTLYKHFNNLVVEYSKEYPVNVDLAKYKGMELLTLFIIANLLKKFNIVCNIVCDMEPEMKILCDRFFINF